MAGCDLNDADGSAGGFGGTAVESRNICVADIH